MRFSLPSPNAPLSTPLINREHLVRTLQTQLTGESSILIVEGETGIGKTTLLEQFYNTFSSNSIALWISSASRWAYDPLMASFDLCTQMEWLLHNRALPEGFEPTDKTLPRYYTNLAGTYRRTGTQYYIIVDGLHEIADTDSTSVQSILDLLPFGHPGFRFILSGTVDGLPLGTAVKERAKTFPIPFWNQDDVRRYFDGISITDDDIKHVYEISRGVPGYLAAIRRLLLSEGGDDLDIATLPRAIEELVALEWKKHTTPTNEVQQQALGILAYEGVPYTAAEMAAIVCNDVAKVEDSLSAIPFLLQDEGGYFRYTSDTFRRFAAERLRTSRPQLNDLFIQHYLNKPDDDIALAKLPSLFQSAHKLRELVAYLSPERFARLYRRSTSLRMVQQHAEHGIEAAKTLKDEGHVVSFTLQKCAVQEMAEAGLDEAEATAHCAIGDTEGALAIAESAPLVESRLRILAAMGRTLSEHRRSIDPRLVERLRELYPRIDPDILGRDIRSVASDLFYTCPDLAIELISGSHGGHGGDNSLDFALAGLAIQAALAEEVPDNEQYAQRIRERISDPFAQRLSADASIVLGRYSAKRAIDEAERLPNGSDRLYVLQHWMLANRERQDAVDVLEYALDTAIRTTTFTPSARVFRELATCLPYVASVQTLTYFVGLLDAQKQILHDRGPSQEYVRLQLILARAQWNHDQEAARGRFEEVVDAIDGIHDVVARCSAYARLIAALERAKRNNRSGDLDTLSDMASEAMDKELSTVLASSIEHDRQCREILSALGTVQPQRALGIVTRMNTQVTRDSAYGFLAESLASAPDDMLDGTIVDMALERIMSTTARDESIRRIVRATLGHIQQNPLTEERVHLLELTYQIHDYSDKAILLASVLRACVQNPKDTSALEGTAQRELADAWRDQEDDWEKVNVGLRIVTELGAAIPETAIAFINDTQELKECLCLPDQEARLTVFSTLRLANRSYSGIAAAGLDTTDDLDRLLRAIERCDGTADQAYLLADLGLWLLVRGEQKKGTKVIQEQLIPLVSSIRATSRTKTEVLTAVAPALHRGAPSAAEGMIDSLPTEWRDRAWGRVLNNIFTHVGLGDPCEKGIGKNVLSFEMASSVIGILRRITEDATIYMYIERLVDAIDTTHNPTISRSQKAELARRLAITLDNKLPAPGFIEHEGYVLVAEAQLNRIRDKRDRVPLQDLVRRARDIPNMPDKAYVLGVLAETTSGARGRHLVKEARSVADQIPILGERIGRYQTLASLWQERLPSTAKELVTEAFTLLTGGEGGSPVRRRQSLIELAYRIEPEFADSLVASLDDDPAKQYVSTNLQAFKTRDAIASKGRSSRPQNDTALSRGVWMKLGLLNAGRTMAVPPSRALPVLGFASTLPISTAYPVFAWFIENAIQRNTTTKAARTYVLPLLEACLRGAELGIHASAGASKFEWDLGRMDNLVDTTRIQIGSGDRLKGLEAINDWLEATKPARLWIIEPYFRSDDIEFLKLIQLHCEDSRVTILTGIPPSQSSEWDPASEYLRAWRRTSDDEPPNVTIVVVQTEQGCPIHDRWWLGETSGLSLGTSLGGLGKKESEISLLNEVETRHETRRMEPFINRSIKHYQGERIRNMSFTL